MTIKQGDTVKVTLTYANNSGAIGRVEQVPESPSDELYLVKLDNGIGAWLFKEEFELYTPAVNTLKEKIETKIEEFKEKPSTGKLTRDCVTEGIITGLQLALDILNETE